MIKVLDCRKKNYISQLNLLLEKRKSGTRLSTNIVTKIINDVKKNKIKALLKYENRFSQNKEIKPSKEKITRAIRSLDPKIKEAIDFYTQAGMTEGQIKTFIKRFGFFGSIIHPLPEAYTRLKDSDVLNVDGIEWAVIEGRGHSLEHLCFFSKELNMFISGDQLLPTISSHVGIFPTEPKANPVEEWIASCHKLIDVLPQDVFVLPAHGRPFIGAHKRLHALIEHHETSLSKLYDALKTPKRSVDVFDVLFKREIDEGNLIMATGESLAHLNCLIYRGQIRKYLKDGHSWYEQI